jgi:transposase
MGKPYSQDLRERVIAAVDGGIGAYAAAALFRVSVSYIYKALGRRRATGESKAPTGRAGRKAKLAGHDEALRARVAVVPDATLEELQVWLATERQVEVSIRCLWNRLQRLKLPLKKSHNTLPNRSGQMSPRLVMRGFSRSSLTERNAFESRDPCEVVTRSGTNRSADALNCADISMRK